MMIDVDRWYTSHWPQLFLPKGHDSPHLDHFTSSGGGGGDFDANAADAQAGHPQAGPHQAGCAARAGAAAHDETTGQSEEVLQRREEQDCLDGAVQYRRLPQIFLC